jgi:hypothetical protein
MFKQATSRRAVALAILAFVLCGATGVFVYKKTKDFFVPATPAVPAPATLAAAPDIAEEHRFDWEAYFFPALEERTKRVDLPSLRTMQLGETDVEVRFWYDVSPGTINGFVIRRYGANWSAIGLRQVRDPWPSAVKLENLGTPKSGWDVFWQQLTAAGVLVLSDSDEAKCTAGVLDGVGYVVEVVAEQKYRTYRYGNPQFAPCDEAKQILSIEALIGDEFNIRPRQR